MKLFLASLGLTDNLLPHLARLVGSDEAPKRAVIIPNASDLRDAAKQAELLSFNKILETYDIQYEIVDLRTTDRTSLTNLLQQADLLWVPGGNTFHLMRYFIDLNLKPLLEDFLERGGVYAGGSAGAIITGPSLDGFEAGDNPLDTGLLGETGLGIVNFVVIPHVDSSAAFANIYERLAQSSPFEVQALRDNEAILHIDGVNTKIS